MRSSEAWFTRSLPLLSVCLSSCFVYVESGLWIAVFSRFSVCFQQGTPLTFSVAPLLWPVQGSLVGQDGRLGQVFVFTEGSQVPLRAGPLGGPHIERGRSVGSELSSSVALACVSDWHQVLSEGKVAGMRRGWEQGGSLGLAKGCWRVEWVPEIKGAQS